MPPRIAFIELNEDGSTGGSHQSLAWLVTNLDRRVVDPVVVFYQDNPVAARLRAAGFSVETWDARRQVERGWRGNRVASIVAQPRLLAHRLRWIRERGISLVHINNSPFAGFDDWLPASWAAGIPCIAHARGAQQSPPGLGRRLLSPRFRRVIAISDHVARSWLRFGIPAERLVILPNGIDLDAFRARFTTPPAAVRAALGVPDGHHLLVLVGNLLSWKGQDVAIEALARLPADLRHRTVLALAGGASRSEGVAYREGLEQAISRHDLGRQVLLLGPRADAPDLMRAADLVLHASTTPEPFGLVVLEAMAAGRPVVATLGGGPSEIVTSESGVLVPAGDPAALSGVIRDVLLDTGRRRRLAEGATRRVEEFSIARTARGMEAVYGELLGTAGPPVRQPAHPPGRDAG